MISPHKLSEKAPSSLPDKNRSSYAPLAVPELLRLQQGHTGVPRITGSWVGMERGGAAGSSSWLCWSPLGHWLTAPKVRSKTGSECSFY